MYDWSVQKSTMTLNQRVAILYDIPVDEVLDAVEITGLSNCVVVVAIREFLPDLWL
jgi:hypothetical protein